MRQPYLALRRCAGRESPALERTLAGHAGGEMAVAVTPDGRRVLSASDDGTLRPCDISVELDADLETGRELAPGALDGALHCLALSSGWGGLRGWRW